MVEHSLWERVAVGSNPIIPIAVRHKQYLLIRMEPSNTHIIAQDPFVFYEQIIPEKLIDLMVEELGFDYDFSLIIFINFILLCGFDY